MGLKCTITDPNVSKNCSSWPFNSINMFVVTDHALITLVLDFVNTAAKQEDIIMIIT